MECLGAATTSSSGQNNAATAGGESDQLANSSTVSGDEEVIWIEEPSEEEEGPSSMEKAGTKRRRGQKKGDGEEEVVEGSSLEVKEEDRFPDEISGISAESEEQSESREEREIEPNRLITTLQDLVDTSERHQKKGGGGDGMMEGRREENEGEGAAPAMAQAQIPVPAENGEEGEEEIRLTIFPMKNDEKKEEEERSVGGTEIPTEVFPRNGENGAATIDGIQREMPPPTSVANSSEEDGRELPLEGTEERAAIPSEKAAEQIENKGAMEEVGKAKEEGEEKEEKKEETPIGGGGKKEEEECRRKDESAIQFSFKSVEKAANEEEEKAKEEDEEKGKELSGEAKTENEPEGAEKKEEEKKGEEMQRDDAGSTISSSCASSQQKGVRFTDGKGALTDEDLAKLEEYEEKMRRRSKEALELVNRICGLQAGECEKRPPLAKPPTVPPPPIEKEENVRKSAPSEKDQLKEALAAGVHGLGGGGREGTERKAASTPEAPIQMGEGPVLDVESVSVSASLLECPSDCLLLPGNRLLIVDSDAGISLVCLQSKQLLRQLGPKEGIWRNAECACIGGPDGEYVYILLEYNLNNAEEKEMKRRETKVEAEKEGEEAKGGDGTKVEEGKKEDGKKKEGESAEANGQENGTENGRQKEGENGEEKKAEGGRTNGQQQNGQEEGAKQRKGILKGAKDNNGGGKERRGDEAAHQQSDWRRFICRFSTADLAMLDRIEAPKWLRERVVWRCRLCFVAPTQCLYLAANTPNQGFLFELVCPKGRWAECVGTRRHSQFTDLHHFAVVGPVTELLLVESNRSYVQLLSIYNSTVVSSRTLGICERPGALCVDDRGNVLIFDRATSTVGLFSRAFLEKVADLALVDRAHCQLSARQGILAVLCTVTKELKLHRYGEKLAKIEQMMAMGGGGGEEAMMTMRMI